jgi:hypothetical protein
MANDPGNRLNRAGRLTITSTSKIFRDSIGRSINGSRDQADFLRFRLNRSSDLSLNLKGLTANADLALLDAQGKRLQQSRKPGKQNELINTRLEAGTYFLRILPRTSKDATRYRLQYAATPTSTPTPLSNTAPILEGNTGITLAKGTTAGLNGSLLKATDAEQQPGQLVYTLNSLPEHGKLLLNGTALGQNATFTQADIDSGRLSYINLGGIKQLSTNSTEDYIPRVSGSNVVWDGTGGSDGGTDMKSSCSTAQPPLNSPPTALMTLTQVSGSNVVWSGRGGSDGGTDCEIFFFNGTAPLNSPPTALRDFCPKSIWLQCGVGRHSGSDGGTDYEIFLFNGTATTQLTTNSTDDFAPEVSGSNVVWSGRGGSDGGTDSEIFLFNGTTTTQLTTNSTEDVGPKYLAPMWCGQAEAAVMAALIEKSSCSTAPPPLNSLPTALRILTHKFLAPMWCGQA